MSDKSVYKSAAETGKGSYFEGWADNIRERGLTGWRARKKERKMKRLMVALFAVAIVMGCSPTSAPEISISEPISLENGSRYIRYNEASSQVIVFIHGFTGNSSSTWTSEQTGTYWPDLLSKDPIFDGYNIYVYEYSTTLFNERQSIDEITEDVRLFLSADGVTNHEKIIFLVHSMGGVIIRAYLNKYRDIAEKIQFIYFFSTPTTGSHIANLGTIFINNPQIQQLTKMTSASYLADVQRQWLAADHGIDSYCAYELLPTKGVLVVGQESATNLCNKRLDPIESNHLDIVEPASNRDVRYLVFKSAFQEQLSSTPTPTYIETARATNTPSITNTATNTPKPTPTFTQMPTSTKTPTVDVTDAIDLQAKEGWQNTGIKINPGDTVVITYVSGEWSVCPPVCPYVDAEGWYTQDRFTTPDESKNWADNVISGCPHGALIARMDNQTICIGNEAQIEALSEATLELRINDRTIEDNGGVITINITIQ